MEASRQRVGQQLPIIEARRRILGCEDAEVGVDSVLLQQPNTPSLSNRHHSPHQTHRTPQPHSIPAGSHTHTTYLLPSRRVRVVCDDESSSIKAALDASQDLARGQVQLIKQNPESTAKRDSERSKRELELQRRRPRRSRLHSCPSQQTSDGDRGAHIQPDQRSPKTSCKFSHARRLASACRALK